MDTNSIESGDRHLRVLITGFGPFCCGGVSIPVNPSWEAVRLLNIEALQRNLNITVRVEKIPVVYNHVEKIIPELFNIHEPDLTIHLGATDVEGGFLVERQAMREEYCYPDDANMYAPEKRIPIPGPPCVTTDMDLDLITKNFECDPHTNLPICVSDNAGKFVCEFLYYIVLNQREQNRYSVFVHVPLTADHEEIARFSHNVERLLHHCVEHVRQKDCYCL
ncbi:pyrrolidone-carboxylate peptidase-like [Anticarsia gemmatalis]|uniref:pyrrolidone-carboxylate peptidase-like n=1 Tax=Anticarsia gemmatalis TaxID=129554 RepID=UPI003F7716DE